MNKVTTYGNGVEAELGGGRHFGGAELRDSITTTHGRVGRRVDHRTTVRPPRVRRLVEILALDRLERQHQYQCNVLVGVAQRQEQHFAPAASEHAPTPCVVVLIHNAQLLV